MKQVLAIALIVLGVMGLAYGGISFTHQKKDIDLGPIQVSHEQSDTLPIPPIAGGLCLVAGVAGPLADLRARPVGAVERRREVLEEL